jgi:sugar lactone lactonase YvrE
MKKNGSPASGRWLLPFGLLALASTLNAGVIRVSGNTINDPNGNQFLFRGPNLALAWWPVPGTADTAIPELAAADKGNCNGVRIVWDDKIPRNTVAILQSALQRCEDNNLAVILGMHYGAEGLNGGTDPSIVNDAVNYWTGAALSVIKRYENRIVLNIVNEWNGNTAGGDTSVYVATYRSAIATIRNAGIHAPILIDSAGWGQDYSIIYQSGQTLLNSDPDRNVVFAIHMYEMYPDASSVRTALERIKIEKGLPVIVGEFGPINNGHFVDAVSVMNYCEQYQVGSCAWTWHQDPPDLWDMMNGWLWSSGPTTWGNIVFNSPGGIKNSAFNGKGDFGASPVVISTQPRGQTATAGLNATFTVAAGSNPAPTYQWQRRPAGSSTWENLHEGGSYQGVTSATLTVSGATAAMSGDQFRCVITNPSDSTTSSAVALTVAGAASALFQYPAGIAEDTSGNLYVADASSNTIKRITPAGVVSTLAGTAGVAGAQDGTGANAQFNQPSGVAVDTSGNVYVADTGNATIRKITPAGAVTTLAGSAASRGSLDGTGSAASFNSPGGIAVDSAGNLYVADTFSATVRRVTPAGMASTLAGTAGSRGETDGDGAAARFNSPNGVTVDAAGNLYVADTYNDTIRKVTPGGVVTTLAGSTGISGATDLTGINALFNQPYGVAVDTSGNVYVADTANSTIRKITPVGVVTTLAGVAGIAGLGNGTGSSVLFNQPRGLVVDGTGNLTIADTGNGAIRRLAPDGTVTTLALTAAPSGGTTTPPPDGGSGTGSGGGSGGGNGGGGGGAMESWFVAALALWVIARRAARKN